MNLSQKRTSVFFFISLLLTLFIPELHILYFAPFIIILIYKMPLNKALWGALACGLILDLLSSEFRIGMHAITFTITTRALYPLKRNFFADTISTLPIMTFFFSSLSTLLMLSFRFIYSQPTPINLSWAVSDLIVFPLIDAAFAFTLFIIPSLLFGKRQRRSDEYFTEN